jgi:hypothetical protein
MRVIEHHGVSGLKLRVNIPLFFFDLSFELDGDAAANGLRDRAILLVMVDRPLRLSFFPLWYFQMIFDMDSRDQRLVIHVFYVSFNFS